MGKAAENERLKLRATFFNNIAVGAVVGGALLPYLALHQTVAGMTTPTQLFFRFVLPIILAFAVAIASRLRADSLARQIKD
jgi:hypothetical protein